MSSTVLKEADRVMTICNACRYCEGFCAVFPAMELRRTFTGADLNTWPTSATTVVAATTPASMLRPTSST